MHFESDLSATFWDGCQLPTIPRHSDPFLSSQYFFLLQLSRLISGILSHTPHPDFGVQKPECSN